MKTEFDTIFTEKASEEIHTLLWEAVQSALAKQYGNILHSAITERVRQEWLAMEQSDTVLDVAALYELSLWLKKHNIPYWMHGCAGSSFILYLLGITCGNPLPPHYHCTKCHQIHWETNCPDGFDLPHGKLCKKDGTPLVADGHNVPWQTLWGYSDHRPMFDMVLPKYLCDDFVAMLENHWLHRYRTFDNSEAYSDAPAFIKPFFSLCFSFTQDCTMVHKAFYNKQVHAGATELALRSWQTIADYKKSYEDEFMCPPDSFADLISLFGILHSRGTWDDAAVSMTSLLGYSLSDMIAHRDDLYQYLLSHGFLEKDAWKGMNWVRKGQGLPVVTDEMKISRDKWVLDRCERIRYLFPKAHSVENIMFQLKAFVLPEGNQKLSTGYEYWDNSLGGIDKTDVILLGGRPGMGKTQLSLDIAKHITAVGDKKIVVFTSPKEIIRWVNVPHVTILAEEVLGIETIQNKIKSAVFDLAVIDSIQLIKGIGSKNKGITESMMREIQKIAKETETPILLTSNLSRKIENRNDRIPRLEDIPHYKNVVPCVDRIYLLYREAYYAFGANRSEAWLFTAKNVRGPVGEVLLKIDWDDKFLATTQ